MRSKNIRGPKLWALLAAFDATGMLPVTYSTMLVIASNDVETPAWNVPVTLVI